MESQFDNYLYVLDPRSSDSIVYGLDHSDDDGVDLNASITRELDKGVPYLIIYSHYNLASGFTDYDEGDNLTLRIEKV